MASCAALQPQRARVCDRAAGRASGQRLRYSACCRRAGESDRARPARAHCPADPARARQRPTSASVAATTRAARMPTRQPRSHPVQPLQTSSRRGKLTGATPIAGHGCTARYSLCRNPPAISQKRGSGSNTASKPSCASAVWYVRSQPPATARAVKMMEGPSPGRPGGGPTTPPPEIRDPPKTPASKWPAAGLGSERWRPVRYVCVCVWKGTCPGLETLQVSRSVRVSV